MNRRTFPEPGRIGTGIQTVRSRRTGGLALGLTALLAACQTTPPPPIVVEDEQMVPEPGWRGSAALEDQDRIDSLDQAWSEALRVAGRRHSRQIAAEGPLLDPDAALPFPMPTPGNYTCRWIRLGSNEPGARDFIAYRSFYCFVGAEDGLLSLIKQTGSDRPSGYLFDDGPTRMIFLGSLALGNEDESLAYGQDPRRDLAGAFERVGSFRFRLVIPRPRSGAILEVIELTPAPVQND